MVRHGSGRCTKNLQGKGRKKEIGGKKEKREEKEKREGKVKRKRKERKKRTREKDVLAVYYGCKTPLWNCPKIIKGTKRVGLEKKS